MSEVFAVPRVHKLIPATAIPFGAFLVGLAFWMQTSPIGHHPKGGAESVAVVLFAGFVITAMGVVTPLFELLIRRRAIAQLPDSD
jgi:uncharacterized membrane protein